MLDKILFLAYETFTEFNNTDATGLLLYPAEVVTVFVPMLLFTIFVITLTATYFSGKRFSGKGDFLASFAVAGYFVFILACFMSLIEGLINITTWSVSLAVAAIGSILLLTSKNR